MIDTIPRPDASLPELLAARARHASDARLAADTLAGFAVAVAAIMWHGPAWELLASIAGCFFAFGLWGIADRELGERAESASPVARIVLRTTRVVAVVLGTIAVIAAVLVGLGVALGRMIS